MNNYLIDTHVLLWLNFSPEQLPKKTLNFLKNRDNKLLVSVISFWEISLKYQLGKLHLSGVMPVDLLASTKQMGIEIAPISPEVFAGFYQLPSINGHKDPFDRMMIWQCICEKYTLITFDEKFDLYTSHGLKILTV